MSRLLRTGIIAAILAGEEIPISAVDLEFFIKAGIVDDLSPNDYTINNTGVTLLAADLNGKDVFDFDGSSYLELANNGDVDLTSDLTIHVVVKQDNSDNSYYVIKGNNETANANQYMINYNNGADQQVARVGLGGSNTTVDIPTADEQNYHIISLRLKVSDVLEIYQDSILIDTTSAPASISARSEKLTIGAHSTAAKQFKMTGKIASVIIRSNSSEIDFADDMTWLSSEYDLGGPVFAADWDTTQAGSASDTIIIPFTADQDLTIDWGDGNIDVITTAAAATHTYSVGGTYTVIVKETSGGFVKHLMFDNGGDKAKINIIRASAGLDFQTSMRRVWYGCSNLDWQAIDTPQIASVKDMTQAFFNAKMSSLPDHWVFDSGEDFNSTFRGATNLVDLPQWSTPNMDEGPSFLLSVTVSTTSWSNFLIKLEDENAVNNVILSGGNSKHNAAGAVAIAALVVRGWTITDGGLE